MIEKNYSIKLRADEAFSDYLNSHLPQRPEPQPPLNNRPQKPPQILRCREELRALARVTNVVTGEDGGASGRGDLIEEPGLPVPPREGAVLEVAEA